MTPYFPTNRAFVRVFTHNKILPCENTHSALVVSEAMIKKQAEKDQKEGIGCPLELHLMNVP